MMYSYKSENEVKRLADKFIGEIFENEDCFDSNVLRDYI